MNQWIKIEKCKCGKYPLILPLPKKQQEIFCQDCDTPAFKSAEDWNDYIKTNNTK